MATAKFNVVLIEPEIPQNTGNIGRLCLAVGAQLHLVKPLGFDIGEKALRRAGLDYWQYIDLKVHESAEDFFSFLPTEAPRILLSKKAGKTLYEHSFIDGTWMIFGKETMGIPDWILNRYAADGLRIPMKDARVRSHNLSHAVGIVVYEAVRQLGL